MERYTNRLQELINFEQEQSQKLNKFSQLRLAVFVIALVSLIYLFWDRVTSTGLLVLFLFVVLFIIIVNNHVKLKNTLRRTQAKIKINQAYIDRAGGNWNYFNDMGTDFADGKHPFSSDLDLFGRNSLYQLINIGNTYFGRTTLRDFLLNPIKTVEHIYKQQQAVEELAARQQFAENLQTEGLLSDNTDQNPARLLAYFEKTDKLIKSDRLKIAFYILPAITLLSLVVLIYDVIQGNGLSGGLLAPVIPLTFVVLQLLLTAYSYLRNAETLNVVNDYKNEIEAYSSIIKVIESATFDDEYLQELQTKLFTNNQPVAKQLASLDKVIMAISVRSSAFLNFLLNAIFLWDYHCVFQLEKWQHAYGSNVRKWLVTIGQFEALTSLSVLRSINPDWCYPVMRTTNYTTVQEQQISTQEISQPLSTMKQQIQMQSNTDKLQFISKGMGHPLINQQTRVNNDFTITDSVAVITGSNMSGKTTLLRTVGINLVLAYAGAPVCADELDCSIMDIFTSMRITDDLNSGISSFYAELLRIKMIIEHSEKEQPMLFLIDEIFRGTNSNDRIEGARTVLKNLSQPWIIGLISTHDFELCDLENDKGVKVTNYHFTEHYIDNEIKFDYKLRIGRSQTTNAKYLMKMVGIKFD